MIDSFNTAQRFSECANSRTLAYNKLKIGVAAYRDFLTARLTDLANLSVNDIAPAAEIEDVVSIPLHHLQGIDVAKIIAVPRSIIAGLVSDAELAMDSVDLADLLSPVGDRVRLTIEELQTVVSDYASSLGDQVTLLDAALTEGFFSKVDITSVVARLELGGKKVSAQVGQLINSLPSGSTWVDALYGMFDPAQTEVSDFIDNSFSLSQWNDTNVFVDALGMIWDDITSAFGTIKAQISKLGDFFKQLWEGIKRLFNYLLSLIDANLLCDYTVDKGAALEAIDIPAVIVRSKGYKPVTDSVRYINWRLVYGFQPEGLDATKLAAIPARWLDIDASSAMYTQEAIDAIDDVVQDTIRDLDGKRVTFPTCSGYVSMGAEKGSLNVAYYKGMHCLSDRPAAIPIINEGTNELSFQPVTDTPTGIVGVPVQYEMKTYPDTLSSNEDVLDPYVESLTTRNRMIHGGEYVGDPLLTRSFTVRAPVRVMDAYIMHQGDNDFFTRAGITLQLMVEPGSHAQLARYQNADVSAKLILADGQALDMPYVHSDANAGRVYPITGSDVSLNSDQTLEGAVCRFETFAYWNEDENQWLSDLRAWLAGAHLEFSIKARAGVMYLHDIDSTFDFPSRSIDAVYFDEWPTYQIPSGNKPFGLANSVLEMVGTGFSSHGEREYDAFADDQIAFWSIMYQLYYGDPSKVALTRAHYTGLKSDSIIAKMRVDNTWNLVGYSSDQFFSPYLQGEPTFKIHAQTDSERAAEVKALIISLFVAALAVTTAVVAKKVKTKVRVKAVQLEEQARQAMKQALLSDPPDGKKINKAQRLLKRSNKLKKWSGMLLGSYPTTSIGEDQEALTTEGLFGSDDQVYFSITGQSLDAD